MIISRRQLQEVLNNLGPDDSSIPINQVGGLIEARLCAGTIYFDFHGEIAETTDLPHRIKLTGPRGGRYQSNEVYPSREAAEADAVNWRSGRKDGTRYRTEVVPV